MRIDILTLFPDMFDAPLQTSIIGRARSSGLLEVHVHDIRDWTLDKHNKVDDRPFGGGPGMVMMCQPLHDAVLAVEETDTRRAHRMLLSPQGRRLTQDIVESLAQQERLLLIAGHYEGIDERVIDALGPEEVSIGDYVLSGGELPAMVLVDAIARLLPGALGHEGSAAEDSFSLKDDDGKPLLDTPHYTRPRDWDGRTVPDVLLSGDHGAIARWRLEQQRDRTRQRRPDLRDDPTG
ncbi:MAG: tRNA (guanosine(37)-N1)-methyltransferase TrmD [Phycisphaerales bacterium]|nr:tRNA (guanosine(37)-N1)-methyltransferase TrmD [Phycisphaerales bacterium]